METEFIEKAYIRALEDEPKLKKVSIDKPGEYFSPERAPKSWIEPRVVEIVRSEERTVTGDEVELWTLQIRCFTKSLEKGRNFLGLSKIVDCVRAVLDPTEGSKAILVKNQENKTIGFLTPQAVDEEREYETTVEIRGVAIPGLDVAILTVPAILTGGC